MLPGSLAHTHRKRKEKWISGLCLALPPRSTSPSELSGLETQLTVRDARKVSCTEILQQASKLLNHGVLLVKKLPLRSNSP